MKHFNVLQRIPGADLKYLEPIKRFAKSPGDGRLVEVRVWANKSSSPAALHDYLLIKIDGAELGLLSYNATVNKFLPISVVDMVRDIRAMKILSTRDGSQLVFVQTRAAQETSFTNLLLDFDGSTGIKFRRVYEFQSREEIRVEVLDTDSGDVLAQYSGHLDAVDLYALKWISDGVLALERHGLVDKKGVTAVAALGRNCFALLVAKKQVEIWRYDQSMGDQFQLLFVLSSLVDPIALATCPFKQQQLIAVQCAGHVVEIFVLVQGRPLQRYQTLQINDQPLHLRFVLMTSGELMLVVSTTNGQRPLIVYRFAGLSLFVERLGYSKLGISGRRISDLIIEGAPEPRNFMIVVADREAVILEAITEQ